MRLLRVSCMSVAAGCPSCLKALLEGQKQLQAHLLAEGVADPFLNQACPSLVPCVGVVEPGGTPLFWGTRRVREEGCEFENPNLFCSFLQSPPPLAGDCSR